jgi:hypothetical protein
MAQQLLNGANVGAAGQEMRRERMTKGIARDPLIEASLARRAHDRAMQCRLMQVMAATHARPINESARRRKDVRPAPIALECGRKGRRPHTGSEIAIPAAAKLGESWPQHANGARRWRRTGTIPDMCSKCALSTCT